LKNATVYKNAGAEIPKGILLEGPPGTGKTLLAKAIASETDAWFLTVSASEFIELFVGLGAQKIRNLFAKARENKPAIIFIDEIDSIGRQRGAGVNMGNDEREQTLNQLLAEMDGFAPNDGVIVIAATNRRDVLDAALLRPGRFDRIVNVPLPDRESRRAILGVHTQNKTMDPSIQLDFLSEATGGFSGADLKNLINEAAIYAARAGNVTITQQNMEDALEKSVVGIVKKVDTRSEDARMRVAIHEIGHAFLASHFREYFQLKKVTIQSTYNGAGGYTLFSEYPEVTESGLYTKDLLKKRLVVALGGKASEKVFYGREEVSLGAVQDLKQANSMARRMIGNYGMGEDLEVFFNENMDSSRNPFLGRSLASSSEYSDKTLESVDKESLRLVNDAYSEAVDILEQNQNTVLLLVNLLMNGTTLSGETVGNLVI
jgi:cell division protease FtsH